VQSVRESLDKRDHMLKARSKTGKVCAKPIRFCTGKALTIRLSVSGLTPSYTKAYQHDLTRLLLIPYRSIVHNRPFREHAEAPIYAVKMERKVCSAPMSGHC
jgi:hypothetical protein